MADSDQHTQLGGEALAREPRVSAVADALPALVFMTDANGRNRFANQRLQTYTGRPAQAFRDDGWLEVLHPEDRPRAVLLWNRCVATGKPHEAEYRLARHDGDYRWHICRAEPVRDAAGAVSEWFGTCLDIEERKRAEKALRESEHRYKTMIDTAPIILWAAADDGSCSFLSGGWYEYTGQTEEQALGFGWLQAVHPEDRDEWGRVFLRACKEPEAFALDLRLRRADGEHRWVLDSGRPRFSPAGEFLGFIGALIEVQERKAAEEELRDTDRRKAEFLATLSHELRNPLAPIHNGLEVLKQLGDGNPRLQRSAETMERQIHHLERLVNDLMNVSRVIHGKIALRFDRVLLDEVLAQEIESSRTLVESKQLELITDIAEERLVVHADTDRLSQVLVNLLSNATKYTDPGGKIWLSLRRDGIHAVISVRDSGIGIRQEDCEKVFELFSQVRPGHLNPGLGIGLALVRQLVELHGGTVGVQSGGLGSGSTFVVRLPLAP